MPAGPVLDLGFTARLKPCPSLSRVGGFWRVGILVRAAYSRFLALLGMTISRRVALVSVDPNERPTEILRWESLARERLLCVIEICGWNGWATRQTGVSGLHGAEQVPGFAVGFVDSLAAGAFGAE